MDSADGTLFFLAVRFIQPPFLLRGPPQRNQMVILVHPILADFEDQGEEAAFYPSDGAILLRVVRALILVVRALEDFLRLFKADSSLWVPAQGFAFRATEPKMHMV